MNSGTGAWDLRKRGIRNTREEKTRLISLRPMYTTEVAIHLVLK